MSPPHARALAELERTRANGLQVGVISAVDLAAARVRVQMAGLVSAWLPWLVTRAGGGVRIWAPPGVDEQVVVACPDGDPAGGVVMGSLYQQSQAAPANAAEVTRLAFDDGAMLSYDRTSKTLEITLPAGAVLTLAAPGGVQIDGDVTVTGTLSATTDVRAGTVSLAQHLHSGVTVGSGVTGVPAP